MNKKYTVASGSERARKIEACSPKHAVVQFLLAAKKDLGLLVEVKGAGSRPTVYFGTETVLRELGMWAKENA